MDINHLINEYLVNYFTEGSCWLPGGSGVVPSVGPVGGSVGGTLLLHLNRKLFQRTLKHSTPEKSVYFRGKKHKQDTLSCKKETNVSIFWDLISERTNRTAKYFHAHSVIVHIFPVIF